MINQKVCNAVVFKRTGSGIKYLILKRAKYFNGVKWLEGNWTIPKALKKDVQSDEATALNQVRTDAGITPKFVCSIGQGRPFVFYWEGKKFNRENHFLLYEARDESIRLKEDYSDYHWGDLKDVKRKMAFQSATKMFDLAEKIIKEQLAGQSSTQPSAEEKNSS